MVKLKGIGGIFFKADDPGTLVDWYRNVLGVGAPGNEHMASTEGHPSVRFLWRDPVDPDREECTVWGPFPRDTDYFKPSEGSWMINFIVQDLDGALAELREKGAAVDDEVQEYSYGRFAWVMDPEGNRIELWEPPEVMPEGF